MNPIAKRTVTALSIATILVLTLVYVPLRYLSPILLFLIAMVQYEFSVMVSRKYEILVWPGVIAGFLYSAVALCGSYNYDFMPFLPILFPVIIFAIMLSALFYKTEKPLQAMAMTIGGFIYIPFMLSFLFFLNLLNSNQSNIFFLYILSIIKISDMGGFAFGMAFGKHKMCPSISPKKSWEGMAGSLFASCVISCAFMPLTHFNFITSISLGLLAAIVGTLGDLIESRIKRDIGVKDSSQFKWTNGMGGFLDMFDSLIFAPALIILTYWSLFFYGVASL